MTQAELEDAYFLIFKSPQGRKVLEDMEKAHKIRESSLIGTRGPSDVGPIDPFALAVHEGERNVVLRIKTIIAQGESK